MGSNPSFSEDKAALFLTMAQALEAVCIDLHQYEPQTLLLCELVRLLAGGCRLFAREPGQAGLWIRTAGSSRMRWMDAPELVEHVCEMLRNADLSPERLADVCARVFQTRAIVHQDPATASAGIRIETGMEDFSCRQCGRCCRSLDYHDALTAEDVAVWKRSGRSDILRWVGAFPDRNRKTVYRIWTVPGTRKLADVCPFLENRSSENRWICRIHDVKPAICRQYPVSRKHAMMTGCPGFARRKDS